MTMSDIVGFSLTMASEFAGCDVVLGSTSSSFSSSDDEADEDEWLMCADDDDDGWHAVDVDSSASLGNGRTFAAVFGRLSAVVVVVALSSQPKHCCFAGILPTVTSHKLNQANRLWYKPYHSVPLYWLAWYIYSYTIQFYLSVVIMAYTSVFWPWHFSALTLSAGHKEGAKKIHLTNHHGLSLTLQRNPISM